MKYYSSSIIGNGTEDDPYRPKVANYKCSYSTVYEMPDAKSSIVVVNATPEVFAQIGTDPEITLLADNLEDAVTPEEFQRICPKGTVMVYG